MGEETGGHPFFALSRNSPGKLHGLPLNLLARAHLKGLEQHIGLQNLSGSRKITAWHFGLRFQKPVA